MLPGDFTVSEGHGHPLVLLMCGFFEVLFLDEEGTKATRKITLVEWNDMNFFLFKYVLNFNSNTQRPEVMLTHIVKVSFPNLHEQFKNDKTFTIMTSKIGKVMEIELVELYVKKLVGLMITVEIRDISKLVGHIRIPLMIENATPKETIL